MPDCFPLYLHHLTVPCTSTPVSPYPLKYLFSIFQTTMILRVVKWDIIFILIYLVLILCLLPICLTSWVKFKFIFFAQFLTRLSFWCWVSGALKIYIFWILSSSQIYDLQIIFFYAIGYLFTFWKYPLMHLLKK